MIDREELRRLCNDATDGPWNAYIDLDDKFGSPERVTVAQSRRGDATFGIIYEIDPEEGSNPERNAAFIAAARTAVPSLLEALEAAEAREKRLREALSLAECVYRKNCVSIGEPSSVLAEMQTALAETAP